MHTTSRRDFITLLSSNLTLSATMESQLLVAEDRDIIGTDVRRNEVGCTVGVQVGCPHGLGAIAVSQPKQERLTRPRFGQ